MKIKDRRAKTGERILIINPQLNGDAYKIGDIFTVKSSVSSYVYTEEIDTAIYHIEYRVIEEEAIIVKTVELNLRQLDGITMLKNDGSWSLTEAIETSMAKSFKAYKELNGLSDVQVATAWVSPEKVEVVPEYRVLSPEEALSSFISGDSVEFMNKNQTEWWKLTEQAAISVLKDCKLRKEVTA